MEIRFGNIKDLPGVQRLNKALVLYESEFVPNGQSIAEDWAYSTDGVAHLTKHLNRESDTAIIIAEADEKVVGYLSASCTSNSHRRQNPVAEIETMYVEEEHRRQGIGGKLLEAFIEWAQVQGAAHLEVMAWAGNKHTLEFYHHFDFVEDAIRLTRNSQRRSK
jgi:GNAT superfamily N-acetyltransferase